MKSRCYFLLRSAQMLHPILAAIDPTVSVGSGVEAGVFVHAAVEEVLNVWSVTSVNLPLMPFC
jgi:hypothetical protein